MSSGAESPLRRQRRSATLIGCARGAGPARRRRRSRRPGRRHHRASPRHRHGPRRRAAAPPRRDSAQHPVLVRTPRRRSRHSSARSLRLAGRPPGPTGGDGAGVDVRPGWSAWGLFPDNMVGLYDGQLRHVLVTARALILATGATDLHLAFPAGPSAACSAAAARCTCWSRAATSTPGGCSCSARAPWRRRRSQSAGRWRRRRRAGRDRRGRPRSGRRRLPGLDAPHHPCGARRRGRRAGDPERPRPGGELTLEVDSVCVAIGQQPSVELAALIDSARV